MDELYFELGYIETNYFFSFLEGSASIESSITFTSAINKIRNVDSALTSLFASSSAVTKTVNVNAVFTSAFTQTGTISHIEGADLFAFTNAAIAVQVDRIRDNNIAASSVFNIAIDFVVKRNADADVDAIFSAIINGLRSRDTNLETQAAFSFDATVRATKVFASAISSESSVLLTPNRLRNNIIDTTATATTSATGLRIRSSAVSLTEQFSVDVTARKYRDAILTGTGVAVIECNAVKTARASSSQQAQFTQTAQAGIAVVATANLESFASILVSRNVGEPGRPRNLIDNFVNSGPGFTTNAKFGSHSLSGGNNVVLAGLANNLIVPTTAQSFYLEMWHYPTTSDTNHEFFAMFEFFIISQTNTGKYRFQGRGGNPNDSSNTSAAYQYTHTVNHTLNQWNHLAIVKQGNSLAYYINGTRVYFYGYPTTTANPDEPLPFYGWGTTGNQTGGVYGTGTIRTSNIICRGGPYLLDEVFYVQDTTLGFSPTSATIDVPTQARSNTANTQFLYHFNNNVNDDVSIQHLGSAGLTSVSSVSAIVGFITNGQATLSTSSSITAVIGTLESINLLAFSDAAVTTNANRLRGYNAECSTSASASATAFRIKQFASEITASSSINIQAIKTAVGSSNNSIAVTQTSQAVKTVSTGSSLSLESTFTGTISHIEGADLVALSDAALTVAFARIREFNSAQASQFTQIANANKTVDVTSSQFSESAQTADVSRTRNASANFALSVSLVSIGTKFKGSAVALTSAFDTINRYLDDDYIQSGYYQQFEIIAQKTASCIAAIQSVSTLTASITGSVFAVLTAQSSSSVIVTVNKTVSVAIANALVFAQTAIADRIRSTASTFTVNATVTANGLKGGDIALVAFTNASVSILTSINKPASAGLNTTATFIVNTQDSLSITASSNLNVGSTVTSSAKRFAVAQAQIQSAGFVVSVSVAQKIFLAQFATVSTLTVSTVKVARATAGITSTGSVSATIGVRKLATVAITSALTFVVEVRELRLDAIVYVIPAEGWTYRIEGETRLHTILGESRVKEIVGESRLHTINGESRIHII